MELYSIGDIATLRFEYLSTAGVLTTPATVALTITKPDGTVISKTKADMTFATAGVGTYDQAIDMNGVWTYRSVSTSPHDDRSGHLVVGMSVRPGPCEEWILPTDIFDCAPCSTIDSAARDMALAARAATAATEFLYYATARRFPGLCESRVRPCGTCRCGSHAWPRTCGCPEPPSIRLPGPVRGIIGVLVDGVAVARTAYRVDNLSLLVRLDDEAWPSCQDLAAATTELNTFEVHYLRGTAPPEMGEIAANDLGCEMYRGMKGEDCRLPQKVVNVVRQGVSMQFVKPAEIGLTEKGELKTGIASVDLFVATFGMGGARRRRGSISSADIGPSVRRVGT